MTDTAAPAPDASDGADASAGADVSDATLQARARALSSPLRLRILRFCLHEAHTNREIAAEFDLNPGSSLHHVRTLADTGFLRAERTRTGARGSREVPYRATGTSWATPVPGIGQVLIQTFLEEIRDLPADDVDVTRMGFMLNAQGERELVQAFRELTWRFRERGPDADGRPISLMIAVHPESRRGAPTDSE